MRSKSIACVALALEALAGRAAMAQNTLTVPIEVARITNPDLVAGDRSSVTVLRIDPQYTIQMLDGKSRTELSLGALIERSSDTSVSAHRNLPRVGFLWENSTPVSVLTLRASLEEASTRETEFADFGRVSVDSTERTGTLGATLTRELTAGSSFELAGSHSRRSFDTPLLTSYVETRGSGVYSLEQTPTSRYALSVSAARLNPDGAGRSAYRAGFGLGGEFDLGAGTTLGASAGWVRVNVPRSKTHSVGSLRLTHEAERASYVVAWTRDVGASGSVGGYELSEGVEASLTLPLTVSTSVAFGADYARSLEADRDAGSTLYARLRSELTQFWSLTLSVERRRAMPGASPSARGHAITAGLVYSHPDF